MEKKTTLRIGMLAAVAVVSTALAQNPQEEAAFSCASAVNVMDCITQLNSTTKPGELTAIPINSQILGFTGPLQVGLRYDNYLAWIMDVGYAQEFYNTAAAFKLSAGLNELRANVTLGYAISPKQQIKLTYEYLAQNLPFDFASNKVNEWVNQQAFGGAYRYVLDNGVLRALEVYGTYTQAVSKELTALEVYNGELLNNIVYRRIAGGTEARGGVTATLTPTQSTIVKVGAGYSTLYFNTTWESNPSTNTLVYNAEIAQLITPTTLISGGVLSTASGRTYTSKVSQILPWSLEASLTGQYTTTTNEIPGAASVGASLSYPAPKTYTTMVEQGLGKLKEWVRSPVIYNTRVLAKAEQRVVAVQIKTAPIPESTIPVGKTMKPISARDYFNFDQEVYSKVGYVLTSLTQKGNPNNKFDPSALNLTNKPDGSYNAIISSGQMPASAMTPNLYTLTIEASGVRGAEVVSRVTNTVDLKIVGNTAIAAPAWTNSNQLNSAAANAPYPSAGTDLRTLLAPNPDLAAGDSYTFTLSAVQNVPIPAWVKIGGANNQFLVSNNNLNVPADSPNPTPVAISVVSNVSEKSPAVNPKIFYINILNTGTKPTWTDTALPTSLLGAFYTETGGAGAVNLANPKYLASTGFEGGGTLTFDCTKGCKDARTLPVTGLKLNTTGVIDGTPTDLTEIGAAKTFTVTVTNQANLSSTHDYTLTLQQNPDLGKPSWVSVSGSPKPLQSAAAGKAYDEILSNNYVVSPVPNDTLTYQIVPGPGCPWLTASSSPNYNPGHLTGSPTDANKGVCTIQSITATSSATGNSVPFNNKTITVTGNITPTAKTLAAPLYEEDYSSANPVNLNNGYFTDGDPNDKFKFQIISGMTGINLSGDNNQILGGRPTNINDIPGKTPLVIKITSVNNSSLSLDNYTVPNFIVQSNPKLTFSVVWKPGQTLPNARNGVAYTGYYLRDYTDYKTTGNGNNNITDVITWGLSKASCTQVTWIAIDSTTSALSSKTNPATGQNCTIDGKATSLATGTSLNTFGHDQTIQVANGPTWNMTSFSTKWVYYGDPVPDIIVNQAQGYVTPNSGDITSINILNTSDPKFPIWLKGSSSTGKGDTVTIKAALNDPANIDQVQTATDCNQTGSRTSDNPYIALAASDSSGTTPMNFTTCLLPNEKLITSPAFDSSKLTKAVLNSSYNVNVDPYHSSIGALEKTKKGSTEVEDKLQFSPMEKDPQATIPYCGDQDFQISPNGVINNNKVTGSVDCAFKLTFTSKAQGEPSSYKVVIPAATYTLPDWQKNLPNATAGVDSTITLDPNGSEGFLSKTLYAGTPVNNDTYLFTLDPRNDSDNRSCKQWLKLTDSAKGILKGEAPPTSTSTSPCNVYVTVHSNTANKDSALPVKSITITGAGKVVWTTNTAILLPYPVVKGQYNVDSNGNYLIPTGNLIIANPNQGVVTFSDLSPATPQDQLPGGGIPTIPGNVAGFVTIKPVSIDINNNNPTGKFKISAQPTDGIKTQSPNFSVLVTSDLINPTVIASAILPSVIVGKTYTLNLNPYGANGCVNNTPCMNKTQVANTNPPEFINDQPSSLKFTSLTTPTSNCDLNWFKMDELGLLTVNVPAGVPLPPTGCELNFNVQSVRNTVASPRTVMIPIAGSAPLWKTPITAKAVKFDDTTISAADLNDLIDTSNDKLPAYNFYFKTDQGAQTNSKGNWKIVNTGGQFKLYRQLNDGTVESGKKGTYDASKVGSTEDLDIFAWNERGETPAKVPVIVNSDPNVRFSTRAPTITRSVRDTTEYTTPFISAYGNPNNFLDTYAPDGTLVSGDIYTLMDNDVLSSTTDKGFIVARIRAGSPVSGQTTYSIVIPAQNGANAAAGIFSGENLGHEDATQRNFAIWLPPGGFNSKARGTSQDYALVDNLKVIMTAVPEWLCSNSGMVIDFNAGAEAQGFPLKPCIRYATLTNVAILLPGFKVEKSGISGPTGVDIKNFNISDNLIIVRAQQQDESSGIWFWDARDISSMTLTIKVTANDPNNSNPPPLYINIPTLVFPSNKVKFVWVGSSNIWTIIYGPDNKTAQQTTWFYNPQYPFSTTSPYVSYFAVFSPDGVRVRDTLKMQCTQGPMYSGADLNYVKKNDSNTGSITNYGGESGTCENSPLYLTSKGGILKSVFSNNCSTSDFPYPGCKYPVFIRNLDSKAYGGTVPNDGTDVNGKPGVMLRLPDGTPFYMDFYTP